MNCTVCGKPHTKEQPLTIAHNDEWLCPDCLKELDKARRPTGAILFKEVLSIDNVEHICKSAVITTKGTIKVGDVELPIVGFEMR